MDLTTGSIPKKVILYTLPLIATALIQLLFNAADLVVVGMYCGSNSVAAVGSTTAIVHLFIELFFGFASGVSVTVAQSIGAKKPESTAKAVHTAIPLALVCGTVLVIIGVLAARPCLAAMNTPEDILDQAVIYMQIYFVGILPQLTYNFGAAVLHASGETRKPLIFLSVSGVVNILLNLLFVIAFNLDVVGVALATTISQTLSCVLVLRCLRKRTDASRLVFRQMRFHPAALKQILRIGVPAGLQSSFYSLANIFIQTNVNAFGTAAVAGSSAATSIGGFIGALISNYGTTSINFVGQNFGAQKYDRCRASVKWTMFFACLFGAVGSGLAILFGRQLLSIYIGDSPEAIEYGLRKLILVYGFYVTQGVQVASSGSMRGMGVSIPQMVISIFGIGVLRLAWLYVMIDVLGINTIDVVFLTFAVSWTVTAILTFIALQITKKKVLVPLETAGRDVPC